MLHLDFNLSRIFCRVGNRPVAKYEAAVSGRRSAEDAPGQIVRQGPVFSRSKILSQRLSIRAEKRQNTARAHKDRDLPERRSDCYVSASLENSTRPIIGPRA